MIDRRANDKRPGHANRDWLDGHVLKPRWLARFSRLLGLLPPLAVDSRPQRRRHRD